MNIFYLSEDYREAATMQVDKHVVKMIVETAQLLSTSHRMLDDEDTVKETEKMFDITFYKKTHKNHPSAVWARSGSENYKWLVNHFESLCEEYTYRYGKIHKTHAKLELFRQLPKNIKEADFVPPPCCMPDDYKTNDAVESYRRYYSIGKKHLHKWTKREKPNWVDT